MNIPSVESIIFRSDRTSRTRVVCVSVGWSVVLVEIVHWGPLDDSRMGIGEWGMGIGELGSWVIGEWEIGNIKLPSWMTVLIKLIDDLILQWAVLTVFMHTDIISFNLFQTY